MTSNHSATPRSSKRAGAPAKKLPRVTLLAASIGLLFAFVAAAQTATTTTADASKARELAAAREDLRQAAKRVAELSGEFDVARQMAYERRFEQRPVIGVVLAPETKSGVRIAAVTPDSAASKAGLRSGDLLTTINGKALVGKDSEQRLASAREQLGDLDTMSAVTIGYERGGKTASAKVTPQIGERVWIMRDGTGAQFTGRGESMEDTIVWSAARDGAQPRPLPIVSPEVRTEIVRLGPMGDCKGDDCRLPMLAEAFRWSGLNLATVDGQLGRYFGTDHGVLVVSTGPELAGLQAGDVIQRIDGKDVRTPREAMMALRDKPADSKVGVTYLRDRKSASAQITVPKTAMLRLPVPPAPPAPPKPPIAPKAPAAPAPPAPPQALEMPAPPAPPVAPAPPTPPLSVL
ncbi:PDZ domain-containing protein [Lysobacter sp. S4-A87]|uniref:PDZ domain-containing protein n=1 Tax=Lysobacter sp. S4-A87 TaxID=2925843 RepID=UPI001F531374|nr:PDZ domain-containing protein [Lysobacter sp. S4-A87]UNK50827.1 PDZ domain-containing protein [Lysobacter sp. S4-A87]